METNLIKVNFMISTVAPHTRCVDWNSYLHPRKMTLRLVAPHTRCVDWNNLSKKLNPSWLVSHLTRGAWIEIIRAILSRRSIKVAPHTRCVDWNTLSPDFTEVNSNVAPHTRCVDWNICVSTVTIQYNRSHLTRGAWIEILLYLLYSLRISSHLTRGAWIEIYRSLAAFLCLLRSHLTRGAWIEIPITRRIRYAVDRRTSHEVRGLKFFEKIDGEWMRSVAPHTRCVDWNDI